MLYRACRSTTRRFAYLSCALTHIPSQAIDLLVNVALAREAARIQDLGFALQFTAIEVTK
jgi:hypothetical protein